MDSPGPLPSEGEPTAFAALYDECALRCHHYLVVRLGSRDAADDVLQEVFVRLVRKRAELAKVGHRMAYVFAIARNEAIRYADRRGRLANQQQPLTGEDLFLEARSDDPARRDAAEDAAAALQILPEDVREIVELKIYGGLTFREIAELLTLPQGTVATRYRTAMTRLREWLTRQPS